MLFYRIYFGLCQFQFPLYPVSQHCVVLGSHSILCTFPRFLTFILEVLVTHVSVAITAWCRVLLEKLTGLQLVKKFPAFYGTRRFMTAHSSVRHLSLSWASPIQSTYPPPTSWRSIQILSTHLRLGLPSGLFPSGFPTKTSYHISGSDRTPALIPHKNYLLTHHF